MSVHPGQLARVFADLSVLASGTDREMLAGLRERLEARRLRVLVVGEAKRGKSTLVNALLGREVVPAGVTPLTAVAATISYGTDERVEATFGDGHAEKHPLDQLPGLVTERENPGNRRGVTSVTVWVDAPILARGVELVDTPGTGSVHAHNTAAADAALPTMDAAVFVLTADPPVSATERDLLERVARLSVRRFIVLNKADYLDAAQLAESVEFTSEVAAAATGEPARVYPLSARAALGGGDEGFTAFRADFDACLETGRACDVERSAAAHLLRLAAGLLDEVLLARRAARMRDGDAAGRVGQFAARLAAVGERRREVGDRTETESRHLLTALNSAADQQVACLTRDLGAEIDRFLAGELGAAPAAAIERQGRARLADLTRDSVETWRREQRDRLEDGLWRLGTRLAGELDAELSAVRQAAADLLDLDLTVPGHEQRLPVDLRFFYTLEEAVGQTELLAGAVRRRLPGRFGRDRAASYLRREARDLADRQVGRARADFQQRLTEATRELSHATQQRYIQGTARLEAALAAAQRTRDATAAEAAEQDRALADREERLRVILTELSGTQ